MEEMSQGFTQVIQCVWSGSVLMAVCELYLLMVSLRKTKFNWLRKQLSGDPGSKKDDIQMVRRAALAARTACTRTIIWDLYSEIWVRAGRATRKGEPYQWFSSQISLIVISGNFADFSTTNFMTLTEVQWYIEAVQWKSKSRLRQALSRLLWSAGAVPGASEQAASIEEAKLNATKYTPPKIMRITPYT